MTFRTKHTIVLREPGQRIRGVWHDGIEKEPQTIIAGVQPASRSDYEKLRVELNGRAITKAVRIYTGEELPVAGEADDNGAILIYEGDRYLVVARASFRITSLKHNRYLAIKQTAIKN